jgi:alpha-ketoglutarate-dependent taurine dioxygenase
MSEQTRHDTSMADADRPRQRGDGRDSPSGGGIASGLHLGKLGLRVQGVTVEEILKDSEFYVELLTKHHALGFKFLHTTSDEQVAVVDALYRGGEDVPSQGRVQEIDHSWMEDHALNQFDDTEDFIQGNWHLDNPFMEKPPSIQSMSMVKRSEKVRNDDTSVVSLEYLYETMPQHMRDYLEDLQCVHSLGVNNEVEHGTEVQGTPHYGTEVIHPALRTHPVTGRTSFWFGPSREVSPVGGESEQWEEVKQWIRQELRRLELRFSWTWDEGDLFIWDNRNLLHAFSPEFEVGERIFRRYESGVEAPYYNPSAIQQDFDPSSAPVGSSKVERPNPATAARPTATAEFDDSVDAPSIDDWENAIGNPDHIPLVLTEGIYALPEYKHLVNSVTLFIITQDAYSVIPTGVQELCSQIDNPDFNGVQVAYNPDHILISKYAKYWNPGIDPIGQILLFTKNGDIARAYESEADLLANRLPNGVYQALEQIEGMLLARRDLRHAGHAWHYPDFMDYPSHKVRPYRWENLAFMDYANFSEPPPKDFLVQFAIDTVFGCFNHLGTNEERKETIEEIRDFLNLMLEMNEHEIGR